MQLKLNLFGRASILAVLMMAFAVSPANALQVCTRIAADVFCKNEDIPKFDQEQRVIDTRSQPGRITYDTVPKVREQNDWPFAGRRIQAWKRGLMPGRPDLNRLRNLKAE